MDWPLSQLFMSEGSGMNLFHSDPTADDVIFIMGSQTHDVIFQSHLNEKFNQIRIFVADFFRPEIGLKVYQSAICGPLSILT